VTHRSAPFACCHAHGWFARLARSDSDLFLFPAWRERVVTARPERARGRRGRP
jgi:hypothetical protein